MTDAPSILWLHSALDPIGSGELRRLGAPALALDGDGWACAFAPAALAGQQPPSDIVVIPLRAAGFLPQLADGAAAKVVVEIDLRTAVADPEAKATLAGLSNRIVGVVARGPRAAAWAEQVLRGSAPVWVIPDPALRRVELAAAALQLGLPTFAPCETEIPEGTDLWFAEPGDYIEAEEVRELQALWTGEDPLRLIVAPAFIRAWLAQAGIAARSLEWSPATLHQALTTAKRCVFTGSKSYSQARRRVVALRSGATAAPPVSPQPAAFEPARNAASWHEVFKSISAPSDRDTSRRPFKVLVFIDLIQDLDPILPLLDELRARPGVALELAVTSWVLRRSPRIVAEVRARGLKYRPYDRAAVVGGQAPDLGDVDAVVAAAESSLPAHAPAHALIERARAAGIPTFAMQHGVENVGLHLVVGEDDAEVAADHMFVWFSAGRTPSSVAASLKPRLVHVGRPVRPIEVPSEVAGTFATFDSIAVVFENLHWKRYGASWRTRFLTDCTAFAFADPRRAVILKPHHAGLWSVKNRHLIPQWPPNLIVADPTDPFWEPFTAAALVQLADMVVTTPSTAALDAVQAGKPTAVAAYGLELPMFAPLPLLQSADDWLAFSRQADSLDDARRRGAFLSRTVSGDDPARAAADYVVATARERRRRPSAAALGKVVA